MAYIKGCGEHLAERVGEEKEVSNTRKIHHIQNTLTLMWKCRLRFLTTALASRWVKQQRCFQVETHINPSQTKIKLLFKYIMNSWISEKSSSFLEEKNNISTNYELAKVLTLFWWRSKKLCTWKTEKTENCCAHKHAERMPTQSIMVIANLHKSFTISSIFRGKIWIFHQALEIWWTDKRDGPQTTSIRIHE